MSQSSGVGSCFLNPGASTVGSLPRPLSQPDKEEQGRGKDVCLPTTLRTGQTGTSLSPLRVKSWKKKATRTAFGTGDTDMAGANAIIGSTSQVSDLGISPPDSPSGHLPREDLLDCSAQHGQRCSPHLLSPRCHDLPSRFSPSFSRARHGGVAFFLPFLSSPTAKKSPHLAYFSSRGLAQVTLSPS